MNSEVDTSILNSVNIKRFTKSVLESRGAAIDRSNSAKWKVTFPAELSDQLDREHGTLVFDAADRELGAGDLLVQPGTTMFSALLNLVQHRSSIGSLRLTEESLQINPPTVLQESSLQVGTLGFSERASDFALTFHFRVQFETPSSFHSEEMISVTIDPETLTRLPDLTERLTSHLPQLLEQHNDESSRELSHSIVQDAFGEAQQAVIDRSRPIIAELKEKADESATERIEEIANWYEQRREELDKQVVKQRREIGKWQTKRRKARKDSTRLKYTRNMNEAQQELDRLQTEVKKKKQALETEEHEETDEIVARNDIEVDVSLLGVTEVTYARGLLSMRLDSGHAEADVELSYLPATDEYHGLDCSVCARDLTDGVLPQICANGHLVGDPCTSSCRTCGLAYCTGCDTDTQFASCGVCWEDVCRSCASTCSSCGSAICADHAEACGECESTTCRLCGEGCSTCETYHCDSDLNKCPDCGEHHCETHTEACGDCGSRRCRADIGNCSVCDEQVCSEHYESCTTCGKTLCEQHFKPCSECLEGSEEEAKAFCQAHTVECIVGDEVLCVDHRVSVTIGGGHTCHNHRSVCRTCEIGYSETRLTDGQCSACLSIGELEEEHIPAEAKAEFRSVEAGRNEAYIVILGKKLLGRNKVVVYDTQDAEEVSRHSAGMVKQLMGGYR